MANLKYSDKHNMVAFLKKPNESVGFTEVVDFLKGTSLRGYAVDFIPLLPAMLAGATVDQGEGSAQPAEPHYTHVDPISSTSQPPIPSPIPSPPYPSPPPHSPPYSPPHSPHQSPPFSPPHYSPPRSYEAPLPEGNTSGSAEDNMQLKELMDIVPRLVTRIESLETELQQTKITYGKAVLTLVKMVKILEKALKRKTQKGDMVNQRKKHFAEERAKAKRNKPMTQSQLRIYMSNYLKNQGTWKLSQLKNLSFEEIKKEFDKLVQWIDTLVPMDFEATKAKLKRYGEELQTKTSKKLKIDDKVVPTIGEKVAEVKEEEPVKRTGKRKKKKARKDRKYPLSKDACQVMLKMKLLDGTMDEVCYKLLKMIEKQAGIRK
ncbi:hypothetical protein Tco_0617159 [Tanacetum coccineum]